MFTRSYKTGSASSTKERNTNTTSSLRCGTCHGNMNSVSLFVGDIMHSVLHTVSGRTGEEDRIICTIHKYIAILRKDIAQANCYQARRRGRPRPRPACGIARIVVVCTIHDFTAKSADFASIIFRNYHTVHDYTATSYIA